MALDYRQVTLSDIPEIARIRSEEWGTCEYWHGRISGYLSGELDPHKALKPRVGYVAVDGGSLLGFAAGHLTARYECQGELQWINVVEQCRGTGVASALLELVAGWFVGQQAVRACVNVEPDSAAAIRFYTRHGAQKLNEHWLVWEDISAVVEAKKTKRVMPHDMCAIPVAAAARVC